MGIEYELAGDYNTTLDLQPLQEAEETRAGLLGRLRQGLLSKVGMAATIPLTAAVLSSPASSAMAQEAAPNESIHETADEYENVDRLAGLDRFETAAAIARATYGEGNLGLVVIARGDIPVDALTGAPLADFYNAPILLVQPNSVPEVTQDTLNYLFHPDSSRRLIILGGRAAISQEVRDELEVDNYVWREIEGQTRIDTAHRICGSLGGEHIQTRTFFANAYNEMETVIASNGAVASQVEVENQNTKGCVYLHDNGEYNYSGYTSSYETSDYLARAGERHKYNFFVGHSSVGVAAHQREVAYSEPVQYFAAGDSHEETAVALLEQLRQIHPEIGTHTIGVATAANPIDALTASAYLAQQPNRGALLLTDTDELSPATRDFLMQSQPERAVIFGGTAAVSDSVAAHIDGLLQ